MKPASPARRTPRRSSTSLHDACIAIAEDDEAGQAWAYNKGLSGLHVLRLAENDLPQRDSLFETLKKKLDRHAAAFAKDLAFDLSGGKLVMDSLWINILEPGGSHSGHIHPHSVISGTIYITIPPGASALKFEDPRLPMMMAAPTRAGRRAPRPCGRSSTSSRRPVRC